MSRLLQKAEINNLIDKGDLVIDPLLENGQVGDICLDLRLGYEFLVSIQGKTPYLNASGKGLEHSIDASFQETRRMIGDTFLLHTGQTILATTLEYIKLPNNVYAVMNLRSSYTRLGLTVSTLIHPGYIGCISIELTNPNKTSINLTVGARMMQVRIFELEHECNYFERERKYIATVRAEVSGADKDSDLKFLAVIPEIENSSSSLV